tara:strand:- start:2574 stop:3071 length:498 start_codon:yes stop_codon:yes gene_type:complete
MRLIIFAIGYLIIGAWMNLIFNNYFQLLGLKINWILVFILALSFRYSKLALSFVGIFAGLICDANSHGIMGLYGTSFFLILLIVNQVKKVFYSNTFFSVSFSVVGMTIIEGWLSIFLLSFFEPDLEITSLFISTNFLLAIMHGFITPIVLILIIWGERLFLREFA